MGVRYDARAYFYWATGTMRYVNVQKIDTRIPAPQSPNVSDLIQGEHAKNLGKINRPRRNSVIPRLHDEAGSTSWLDERT